MPLTLTARQRPAPLPLSTRALRPSTLGDPRGAKSSAVFLLLDCQQHWTPVVAPSLNCVQLQGPTRLSLAGPSCHLHWLPRRAHQAPGCPCRHVPRAPAGSLPPTPDTHIRRRRRLPTGVPSGRLEWRGSGWAPARPSAGPAPLTSPQSRSLQIKTRVSLDPPLSITHPIQTHRQVTGSAFKLEPEPNACCTLSSLPTRVHATFLCHPDTLSPPNWLPSI